MSARDRWLDEGLAALAADGVAGVRADRIAARLGLTKGSFHHHFAGIEDYRRALLERHERDQLALLDGITAELTSVPAEAALATLPERLIGHFEADLERAVRSWAFTDPAARAVQERLDRARLAFLRGLWTRILGDERQAHIAALVPHLVAIGASMAQPRLAARDLRAVFDLLAALVPSVTQRAR
jgi:AcrR family transcriptional regulator